MNYFKLRTLVIVLIFLMISFIFTYVYTNGNYLRLPSDPNHMQILPMKAYTDNSHQFIYVNNSDKHQEFLIVNKENSVEKHENLNIPNKNEIPIDGAAHISNQQELKKPVFTQNQVNKEEQHVDTNHLHVGVKIDENVAISLPKSTPARPCNRLWVKGRSKWFDQRFDGTISSIWTRDNIKQTSAVKNWWLGIQSSKNKDVLGVMNSVFTMIPDVDVYKDRSKCRRCAVVGNSGNLKGSSYGAEIDAHDMVIRMNEAPLAGFEKDVGYRETHRLMYPESYYSIKQDVHFVLVSFKTLDVEWLMSAMTTGTIKRTWRPVKNLINVNASLVQIYNPALMKYTHEVWNKKQGRYPSTGLLAVMFALHACDEVDVYGYGANKIGNWDHYWQNDGGKGNSAFRKTGVHNSGVESQIYQQLNAEGIVKVHMGNAHR
ncbi:CMP-N-acetylneuraminate-beta-galactosamide-alpha-2,3-sialyltransferase 2-like [Antedon mediterranea]|uniref:CMP-N-acetylneuraminate-beta-galactosamide- alpha-2,3-sialyltransferase 2-like n=1 Tax=Antedon mediterranea TaxID=105859 RepID=UPI003AF6C20B